MRLQTLILMAVIGLAGCGGGDDQLDRELLVPKGMRRTTVTAHDARTEPAAPVAAKTTTAAAAADAPAPLAATPDVPAAVAPASDAPPSAAPPTPPAAAPRPAPRAGDYFVQVGAFRQKATAEDVAGRLRGLGLAAAIEPVETGGGPLHRVVVPGLADRTAADAVVVRVKQELGIDAVVRKP